MSEWICMGNHADPVQTQPGLYLCKGCAKRHRENVLELARLWQDLQDMERPAYSARASGGRRGPSSSAPGSMDMLALTDVRSQYEPGGLPPVANWMRTVAHRISTERRVTRPQSTGEQILLVYRHLNWVQEQEWLDEWLWRLRAMLNGLRRLTGETRHVIDRCQALHPDMDGQECGGPLLQDRDGSASVTCQRCGDRWSDGAVVEAYGELRRLGMILGSGETRPAARSKENEDE